MRSIRPPSRLLVAIGLVGLSAGCGKTPVEPSTHPPPPVTLQRLEIQGSGQPEPVLNGESAYIVSPGEMAEFRALARFSDGTSRDVTHEAAWRTSNFNFLSVAGSGLYAGRMLGAVWIEAAFEQSSGRQQVIVMPRGTYVLGGRVLESRDPLATVALAQLWVLSGPAAGQFVMTDSAGFGFRFYGLSGSTTIRVAKDGYRTIEVPVTVVGHQTLDVDLPLASPRPDLSGSYTLTLTASDVCGAGDGEGELPDEARERKYAAHVTQRGPELSVELSGADFTAPMSGDRRITGRLEPSRVQFDLIWWDANWDFGPPRIVERLPSGETFVVSGSVVATLSNRTVIGTFDGGFLVYPAGVVPDPRTSPSASCYSSRHRFALSRF